MRPARGSGAEEDPVSPAEAGDAGGPDDCAEQVLGEAGDEDPIDHMAPGGFDAWRRRSAAGGAGTAIARGLSAVFAPTENRPVVSAPVPGDPPDSDLGFRVLLDPDDPTRSIVLFTEAAEEEDQESRQIGPIGTPSVPATEPPAAPGVH